MYNGAFFYSQEICKYFIPNIVTDRNWVTIRVEGKCFNHSIVFIHNNNKPEFYDYLKEYEDLILVCGVPSTCEKVAHLGTPIYLPLSIDVDYVKRFKCDKQYNLAYVGRRSKRNGYTFPKGTSFIEGVDRPTLLKEMARFQKVFAVGRTALEAKVLDCEVLPFDTRYPDVSLWQVIDSKDAVSLLQKEIDKIDKKGKRK